MKEKVSVVEWWKCFKQRSLAIETFHLSSDISYTDAQDQLDSTGLNWTQDYKIAPRTTESQA